ncbi:MAG: hypothetical protein Q9192_000527 [Flavoplaca navasiana]
MVINPTYLAQRTRSSVNWQDAKRRVTKSYREWLRSAPEIQQMYSLNMPISEIRTKIRQEFERHRYVNQLPVVDMLLFQNHSEYQETMNYWKQLPHVLKYFREKEDPTAKLPQSFMQGFLEVYRLSPCASIPPPAETAHVGSQLKPDFWGHIVHS